MKDTMNKYSDHFAISSKYFSCVDNATLLTDTKCLLPAACQTCW